MTAVHPNESELLNGPECKPGYLVQVELQLQDIARSRLRIKVEDHLSGVIHHKCCYEELNCRQKAQHEDVRVLVGILDSGEVEEWGDTRAEL